MHEEEQKKALIQQIRDAAGKIGVLEKMEYPGVADAKEYCFQVRCGLSEAVGEILEFEPAALIQFLRYALCGIIDPDNPRIAALMDALQNEIEEQIDSASQDHTEDEPE